MRKAVSPIPLINSGAARPQPDQGDGVQRDLWKLLDKLALCRRHYDLTANSLSVLRALISFLPKTTPASGDLLVWPSNRSLCERADGMDERTLRRHLERLVNAGLISRRASSNGKRFAVRCRRAVVMAFGFDLWPLHERADEIASAAEAVRDQDEQSATLRTEILNLLHSLDDTAAKPDADEEAEIRRILRRRISLERLTELRDQLARAHRKLASVPRILTATDRQIDRHQQRTEKDYYESVCPLPSEAPRETQDLNPQDVKRGNADDDITLKNCLDATSESRAFAQQPVQSWTDLVHLADTLSPMIGIDKELSEHTKRAMGPLQAAISILCIIQRSDRIQRPAAYLRRLAILAEGGQYSLKSMIRGALRRKFAAVNPVPV